MTIQIDAAVLEQAVDYAEHASRCRVEWTPTRKTEPENCTCGFKEWREKVDAILRDHAAREAECDECGNLPSYGHKGTCSFAATPIDITQTGVIIVDDQGARGYSAEQVRKAFRIMGTDHPANGPAEVTEATYIADTPTQSGECGVCKCGHERIYHEDNKGSCNGLRHTQLCFCTQYRDRARGGR
jgi:hypothetical protein